MIEVNNLINGNHIICTTVKDSSFLRQELINPLVQRFFEAQNIQDYEELSIEHNFSDIDFPNIGFDQIYKNLIKDIKKAKAGIRIPIRFFLTIDKQNCLQRCKSTDTFYDTIEINCQPFLYIIYIELSMIIALLRKNRI